MKVLNNIFLIALMASLIFTSCSKDEEVNIQDQTEWEDPKEDNMAHHNPLLSRSSGSDGEGMDFDCFLITFPFSLVDIDGNEYVIASEDDLTAAFEDGTLEVVDFVYPLNVSLDGEDSTVADGDELAELFASCVPIGGWDENSFPAYDISYDNSCWDLVYPVALTDIEGNVVTAEDAESFNALVASDLYFFQFPLTLIDEEGNTLTVANVDDIFEALIDCNGFGDIDTSGYDGGGFDGLGWEWENNFELLGCYEIEFPFSVTTSDGSIVEITSHEDICNLMLQGDVVDYVYPITLTDYEGNTYVVGTSDQLEELMIDCFDFGDGGWTGGGLDSIDVWGPGEEFNDNFDLIILAFLSDDYAENCFDINYPITLVTYEGNTATVSSDEAIIEYSFDPSYSLVYPVSVTYTDGGAVEEFDDANELLTELMNGCE